MATKSKGSDVAVQAVDNDRASTTEADFDDTIAKNRGLPIVEIPTHPAGYRETNAEIRKRRLRRMGGDQQAEALMALQTLVDRATHLEADFGKEYAPDAKKAEVLQARLKKVGPARAAAETLLAYLKEVEEIAWSDTTVLLEEVNKEVVHASSRKPAIAQTYASVVKVFEQRSNAISEGRARSRGAAASSTASESDKGKSGV